MLKAIRIIAGLAACLALSGCFVSKAPLIPVERAVKLLPDSSTVTSSSEGGIVIGENKPDAYNVRWVGPHYAADGISEETQGKKGNWTFADVGQGLYAIQMERTDKSGEAVEYLLLKPKAEGGYDVFLPECGKLPEIERTALNLTPEGAEGHCMMASWPQAERALRASIKTLDEEPGARLTVTPSP